MRCINHRYLTTSLYVKVALRPSYAIQCGVRQQQHKAMLLVGGSTNRYVGKRLLSSSSNKGVHVEHGDPRNKTRAIVLGLCCAVGLGGSVVHSYWDGLESSFEKLQTSVKQIIGVSTNSDEHNEETDNTEQLNIMKTTNSELKIEHLQPQNGVLSDVKENGLFMTVWLKKKSDKEKIAAEIADAVLKLQANGIDLSLGFSEQVYSIFNYKVPSGLFIPFRQSSRHSRSGTIPSTGGSFVIHCKSETQSEVVEVGRVLLDCLDSSDIDKKELVYGFKHFNDLGGTKPCRQQQMSQVEKRAISLVPTTGGTYLLTQQWRHNLDKFKSLNPEDLNTLFASKDFIGSHVDKVSGFNPDCSKLQIVRQSLQVGDTTNGGLYFAAYSKDPVVFSYMLDRMTKRKIRNNSEFIQKRTSDPVLDFSECISSQVVYVPSLEQLRAIAKL